MELVLDSYAWLEYFAGNASYLQLIDSSNAIFTPATVLAEVVRSLLRKKLNHGEVTNFAGFVATRSVILPFGKENAIAAGFLAEEHGLHFADALVYSYANENRRVVTGDNHFKKLPNVEFVA